MDKSRQSLATATLCAHAGPPEPVTQPRAHVAPLYQTAVFDFPSVAASVPALDGDGYVYRRFGLPNSDHLAAAVTVLEGAEAGVATSSGMGAIAAAVLALCNAGDRLLVQRDAYGGSLALVERDLSRLGIHVTAVDIYDLDTLAPALPGARALLVESIANPLLRVADIGALGQLCRAHGTMLICDNTFATPLRDQPISQGADLVVHSVTKFLGGHGDLSAGVLVGAAAPVATAQGLVTRMGLGASPLDAWLAVRGMRTLDVRMRRAWDTAAELAGQLRDHAAIQRVNHADRCALLSIDLGSDRTAQQFIERLQLIALSPSLGGVTTTASHPATSSHRHLTPEARAAAGIGNGLVRLSVGVEAVADLWRDLDRALAGA